MFKNILICVQCYNCMILHKFATFYPKRGLHIEENKLLTYVEHKIIFYCFIIKYVEKKLHRHFSCILQKTFYLIQI